MGSLNNDLHKPLFLSFEYLQNFYLKKHMWKPSQKTPPELLFCFFTDSKKSLGGSFFHQVTVSGSSCVVSWKFFTDACGESHSTHGWKPGPDKSHLLMIQKSSIWKIDQYSRIYIYIYIIYIHITSCMIIYYIFYKRIIPYYRINYESVVNPARELV